MTSIDSTENLPDPIEARLTIWQAICETAATSLRRCAIYRFDHPDPLNHAAFGWSIRELATWQLVEGLSLISILARAERVLGNRVENLFRRTGPIQFQEDKQVRYLWSQPDLSGVDSALGGRPDLVVTSSPEPPSSATVLRVVECKCRKKLSAPDIRAEFGKAHDLRVGSYFVWSYNTPSPRLVEGARRLGIDLETLAFDSPRGAEWVNDPEALFEYVSESLDKSRKGARFAKMLSQTAIDVTKKLSPGGSEDRPRRL